MTFKKLRNNYFSEEIFSIRFFFLLIFQFNHLNFLIYSILFSLATGFYENVVVYLRKKNNVS